MGCWEAILDDILEMVLRKLRTQDVAAVRAVCRAWRAKTDYLLNSMHLQKPQYIPIMVTRFQGLSQLQLVVDAQSQIIAEMLRPLQSLTRLQKLELENTAQAQPHLVGLQQLGDQLTLLTQLHVKACVIGVDCGITSIEGLTSLHLSNCILMVGKAGGFAHMLASCSMLEHLYCVGCSGLSEAPFAGIESLVRLKTCVLDSSLRISDDICNSVASLTQVQKLGLACSALEGCLVPARITDAGVRSLCRMTQLTSLDLSGHAAVSDRSILALAAHLTGLTALDLRKPACDATGSSGVSDEGIAALAGLSLLRTLRMSQVEVGRHGCKALAELRQLQCLEISYCDSLSDTAACALAPLQGLTELSLAGCSGVTDIAVSALVRVMSMLAKLDLSACHMHVSDISLYPVGALKHLQVLRMHSCDRLSDVGVKALCAGAAAAGLMHLDVRGCDRITDAGAACISRHLLQLRTLSLEHCPLIGDRGIRALSVLPHLEILRITCNSPASLVEEFGRKIRLHPYDAKRVWWMPQI